MGTEIKPYTAELEDAVKAFNHRLKHGGATYQFPERHLVPLPKVDGRRIFHEYFVALENGSDVRGAFILQHHEFSKDGQDIPIAHYDLPISEGVVDKKYGLIGVQLVMNALKRQPCLFSLGLGGHNEPLAVMLKKIGWQISEVPFYFKVHHPVRFLRNIRPLRSTPFRRLVLDMAAMSGAGWLGLKTGHFLLTKSSNGIHLQAETVPEFGTWADDLWERCKSEYAMCGIRNREALNLLYSPGKRDFIRLKVSTTEKVLGWAVLLNTQMDNSPHFGNMRVGSIVDCLAPRHDAVHIIRQATDYLESAGVDIIISNQSDAAWGSALKASGFLSGPSNYLFACSKKLAEVLAPLDGNKNRIHLTRGDGGGPMGL